MNGFSQRGHFLLPTCTCNHSIFPPFWFFYVFLSDKFVIDPLEAILTAEFGLLLKKRGVDDKDLLPYFPYRDDGEKLLDVIESMVKDYVDL